MALISATSTATAARGSPTALPGRSADAEYPVWSCVHGMAVLVTRGPLRDMPEDFVRHVGDQLFAFITRGL